MLRASGALPAMVLKMKRTFCKISACSLVGDQSIAVEVAVTS
jgi:hypothetical protein